MKQPLVNPCDNIEDTKLQKLIEFYNETLGFCPNSIKTMYKRPEIAFAFIEMNKAVMENHGKVSSSLKRMIAYISSHASGCRYCEAHAIRAAKRYGADEIKLENIWSYKTHPSFSDEEKSALDFALAASIIPNDVNDQIKENLRKYWDDGEIVEMMGVISLFGFLNRWNDSMGTELEEHAIESGEKYLGKNGWNRGKHQITTSKD